MQNSSPLFRLPKIASLGRISFFGLLSILLAIFASFSLLFVSNSSSSRVLAQTAETFIRIGDGTTPVVRIVGGQQTSIPVYLGNFTDPDGLAAFGFQIRYDPILLPIADANKDEKADTGQVTVGSFLGSTGKEVVCNDGFIDKDPTSSTLKILDYSCVTLGPTPSGPTGSGTLANINITTGNSTGVGSLNFVLTELADDTNDVNLVPHTATAVTPYRIAKCADFTGDKFVAIFDILVLAQKFGLTPASPNWDPKYDIDENNAVTVFDVLIAAREFNQRCP